MKTKKTDKKKSIKKESIKSENDLYLEAFGQRVRELRQSQNLTQEDFAGTLGISNTYLSEIEKGNRNPKLVFYVRLSRELGVSLDYIITGTGPAHAAGAESRGKDPLLLEDVIDTGDMWLLIENSTLFMNTMLSYAAKFFMDNERIIKQNMENLKKDKESQEPQETQESKVSRKGKKRG